MMRMVKVLGDQVLVRVAARQAGRDAPAGFPRPEFRPQLRRAAAGELPQREFAPVLPLPAERDDWLAAADAAIEFWSMAAADNRISASFRAACRVNGRELRRLKTLAA